MAEGQIAVVTAPIVSDAKPVVEGQKSVDKPSDNKDKPAENKDKVVEKLQERRSSGILNDEQKKALEKQLKNRPEVDTLKAQGIVKEGGRLAAAQARLQRELKSDNVARQLDHRPTHEDLVAANIVEDRGVAPSLQAVARKLERNILANTLNQKLYSRSDVTSLKQQNLFKGDNVAPRLRNAKVKLEHAITRDQLGHLLESRPTHDELMRAGIIKPASSLSNKIAGVQRQLQHNMRVDKVGHLLERRSDVDALQDRNVLRDNKISPALQGPQRALERSLARSNLYHALKHRPPLSELQERGVYVGDPYGDEDDIDDSHQQLPLEQQQGGIAYIQEQQRQRGSVNLGQQQGINGISANSNAQNAVESKQAFQAAEPSGYQRRSKNFHLTRILLKFVANMAEAGEISLQAKGYLKDLIVDQDKTILAVAETFDSENDINDFKESLITLASRQK
jgi:hypothetical protein